MECWWGYLLLGLVAGTCGATLGVGGGIVMVPALVMLFHVQQKSAQGMSLAAMTLMALVAALRYWANPEVKMDLAAVALIAAAAIVGALVGAEIARHAPARTLQKLFAVVMVAAAVKLAFFTKPRAAEAGTPAASAAPAAGPAEESPP